MATEPQSVVVIGGGVFGCATAYQLARRGVRTTLIERDAPGSHASGKNAGNLNPIHGAAPRLIPFALKCFELHQTLAAELATLGCADCDLQPVRRIFLAFDEADRRELEQIAASFAGHAGFTTTPLDAEAVLRQEPRLARDIHAGLLVEGNMAVHSRAFNLALAEAAQKSGATLLQHEVVELLKENNRVTGVRSADAVIPCDAVVLATGPWLTGMREWLGYAPPVAPVKGEMLRMRLPGAGLQYDFTHGMISLYRRGRDECWIGVTKEDAGLDETPTAAGLRHLQQAAARLMPAVAQATLLEHAASLRPMSPDGLPMAGRVPGWDNAYVANGGGIKGILLCTGISQAVADMILHGDTALPVTRPTHQED